MLVAGLGGQAVGGALRGDAVQAEALGRGVPDGERSKKSKVRARVASAWTASGESSSTALTTDSTRPRGLPSTWLARRSTAITSATSDSTAATTSPAEMRSALTRRSRRLRDSASAGNASSASKAAVRRRPWPSLWRRWRPAARRAAGRCGRRLRSWRASHPWSWRRGWASAVTRLIGSSGRMVEPRYRHGWTDDCVRSRSAASMRAQRLVAPEHRERLEDARRDRRPGERDADRLEDVLGLGAARLDDPAQRRLDRARASNGSTRASASRASASASRGRPSSSHFSRAFGSSAGPSKMKPASGQKSASVWIFSREIATAGAQAGAAGERLQRAR